MYSSWYMPFSLGANIEMHNEGAQDFSFSLHVSTRPLAAEKADGLLRFHAWWHTGQWAHLDSARFAPGGDRWPDWPLLLARGPGRYCGMHLHVYNTWPQPASPASTWWYGHGDAKSVDWWWGEGDEKFFVDGETFPSTFGTGSEDYIGYAWAAEPPFALFDSPFACQPQTPEDGNGHTSVSRFHICDNIPFGQTFEGFLEKYKDSVWGKERLGRCTYAATPYWYQAPKIAGLYTAAPLSRRLQFLE